MRNIRARTYSRYTKEAAVLLGNLIRLGRIERKMSAQDLAERAGISRTTLHKIENGDMKCEIGLVFEVAALVGVKLFDSDLAGLSTSRKQADDKIALLPKSVHAFKRSIDDDF